MTEKDSEFEVEGRLGLPDLFGIPSLASVAFRYKRRRQQRAEAYLEAVASVSHLSPEVIGAKSEAIPELTDMVIEGGERASRVEDQMYRRTLASVAAAAFQDEAQLDEVALLHSQLLRLEPAHLRVLRALSKIAGSAYFVEGGIVPGSPGNFVWGAGDAIVTGLSAEAVLGTLEVLRSVGMVRPETTVRHSDGSFAIHDYRTAPWSVTPWGHLGLAHVDGDPRD